MSPYEYAQLVGHYNKLQYGPTIDPRILERGYKPEQIKAMKDQMKKSQKQVTSLNIVFKDPIENYTYSQFGYVYTLYKRFVDGGILPFPGSLADQPAQIMEIFNTLESVELEHKQRQQKEQEKKLERKSRGRR